MIIENEQYQQMLDDENVSTPLDNADLLARGAAILTEQDAELAGLLDREIAYQSEVLPLVAYASIADPSVLAAAGSALANVTAEGYPGVRYHPGAGNFDEVEELAIERAKVAFGASYANVQPHSCSSANLTVLFTLLRPGDPILGLALPAGGHLTHGSAASVTGRYFNAVGYGLTADGWIDYDQVAALAAEHKPKVIVAGASAYPRQIDYVRFREIADSVGAYLLADISHIAGLVATGRHPNPVDVAHVTTTSTYKQLGGPRGGLILLGKDSDVRPRGGSTTLATLMQRGVFPRFQGTPSPAAIAAKARAFKLLSQPEFAEMTGRIVADAKALAAALGGHGMRVLTGGTDNHMVLVDTLARGVTGLIAESALQQCGILANKNQIVGDTKSPLVTSGLRFGTNMLAQRGFTPDVMLECAQLVEDVFGNVHVLSDVDYEFPDKAVQEISSRVGELAARFPVQSYLGAAKRRAHAGRVG